MKGLDHLIVVLFGASGLMLGGFLFDIDHAGPVQKLIKGFYSDDYCPECVRGMFHKPLTMLALAAFFICLGLGITFHFIMDYKVAQ